MLEIYAQESDVARSASIVAWRQRYLESVKRCLTTRNREHIKAAILTAKVYRRVRITGSIAVFDDETKVGDLFRKRIHGMVLGTSGAWANFLVADIGLGDPALEDFKAISPFKGCMLLLSRSGNDPVIRGEVAAFRKVFSLGRMTAFNQIFRQEFLPQGARKHHYVLQVLRPEVVSASIAPPQPRASDPSFLRASQVGDLFGSTPPSLPPLMDFGKDTLVENRPALAPDPPTYTSTEPMAAATP